MRTFGALTGVMVLVVSGCATGSGPVGAYYGAAPIGTSAQLAHPVPAGQALVRLPEEAGSVLAVVERRSGEVVAQEIALAADAAALGENKIRVAVGYLNDGGPVLGPRIAPALASDVQKEIAAEFPDVTMRIAETPARNAYGPFGYAAGTRGRYACIYAWQFVPKVGEGSGPLPSVLAAERSAALRIRLCRSGMPKERLVEIVARMSMAMPARGIVIRPVAVPAGGDALDSVYPAY